MTSPASAPACRTCAISASTRSGSTRGTSSPQADAGYDVADYRDIDPLFGTLAEAEALISEAHAHGIRVIVDIVPNHCSDAAPVVPGGARGRPRQPGAGPLPVPARPGRRRRRAAEQLAVQLPRLVVDPGHRGDGQPGEWYMHQFAPEQPDFNWANPEVRAEFESILRFWLDRGVDGFRIDVAHGLVKADGLPDDRVPGRRGTAVRGPGRRARHLARVAAGRRRVPGRAGAGRRGVGARPGALRALPAPRRAALGVQLRLPALRAGTPTRCAPSSTRRWPRTRRSARRRPGCCPTTTSPGTSPATAGRTPRSTSATASWGVPTDLDLGTRRARAAALLTLALPGGVYVYQGDELGLWEVEDIPDELLQDPVWERSGHADRGRDGCRVPLPWSGDAPPFGFSPSPRPSPWLPQPPAWKAYTAAGARPATRARCSSSTARRCAPRGPSRTRRRPDGVAAERPDVLAFTRGDDFACVVNLSARRSRCRRTTRCWWRAGR